MIYDEYIKGIMPILISQYQSGKNPKHYTEEFFKHATPQVIIEAMNMVRNSLRGDGSDGTEKFYKKNMSHMDKVLREEMKLFIEKSESNLIELWKFLAYRLEKSDLKNVSDSERAFLLDEVVDSKIRKSLNTRTRNDLYGRILGVSSSVVPGLMDPRKADQQDRANNFLSGLNLK